MNRSLSRPIPSRAPLSDKRKQYAASSKRYVMNTTGFAQWLKERRRTLDMTQATLGRLAGCSESSIRKIESGILKPSRQDAELLAVSLQVPEAEREAFVPWASSSPN